MADSPRDPTPAAMPRWVKVFGIVAVALLLLFVLLHLTGLNPGHISHHGFN